MGWQMRFRLELKCACIVAGACGLAHGASVRLITIDSTTSQPVPCRVHLKDAEKKPVQPKGLPFWKDHFVCAGDVELELAPGSYTYEIDRGPEHLLASGRFSLAENESPSITNRLRRLVNLAKEGWWSGELHVHRPLSDIELLMQAEDLHIAQPITWWNARNAWAGQPPPTNPFVRFDGDRFYHSMAGEDERGGGALLYFNLREPLKMAAAKREYPSPVEFLREARRHQGVWVDIEKPFWWDAPLWFASGMVDSVGIAHNHMHRGGVLDNEAWGKARDRQRWPGPHGNGLWTQEIYYHLLNCGLRLPPSAGSASGVLPNPVGYDRLYVHIDGPLSYEKWFDGLRLGHVFVSNGPLLRCRANGQWPGQVFHAAAGEELELQLEAALDSRDPVSAIEIIKNGRVERTVPVAELKRSGALGRITFKESGWFLVRAIANVPETFRFVSTGPFYVEVGPTPCRISRASAQFFLDWVRERMGQIKLDDPQQRMEVLKPHQDAEKFWQEKVAQANAE
jgi:hypothetical protein